MDEMEKTLEETNNTQRTENGALGYKSTSNILVDMNFRIPSYRDDRASALSDFRKAFEETPELALKWLFYARDIRKGLGERDLFVSIFKTLLHFQAINEATFKHLLPLIPEYGRWDDVVKLLGISKNYDHIISFFLAIQLSRDEENMEFNKNSVKHMEEYQPVSLLAKWLPSINTSSKETRKKAKLICSLLKLDKSFYRKTLAKLRAYLDVVEVKMSNNNWDKIDYAGVPSKANLLYNTAFFKHDSERRTEFINRVMAGETKINSSVAFPYEIVNKVEEEILKNNHDTKINALEAMWKNLPNYQLADTIVVADGSGSMMSPINKSSNVCALSVANSLAIYFSERLKGMYANRYITFSENPRFVDLAQGQDLVSKLKIAKKHCEVANTNIEKVFELILNTAVSTNAKQEDIPANILIISDMEFDDGAQFDNILFKGIEDSYREKGYKLPKLIFWNVNGRTNTIPLKENENGFALVSGFSLNVFNLITSGKLDPMEALRYVLLSDRYDLIKIMNEPLGKQKPIKTAF
jgi:hypothetical protein